MKKLKHQCTPEEWQAVLAKAREYERRPEVRAKRMEYERERRDKVKRREQHRLRASLEVNRQKRRVHTKKYNADPQVKAYRKEYNLKTMYGISGAELDALVAAQGNKCAVCENPFSTEKKYQKPHVDHCHETGRVRGLLCGACNVIEGLIARVGLCPKEFADRLADYLAKSKEDILW